MVADGLTLPVVQVEDIIGLKVQAAVNDPLRGASDWSDIRVLIETAVHTGQTLDWELLADYLELFELTCELPMLRHWYGQTD